MADDAVLLPQQRDLVRLMWRLREASGCWASLSELAGELSVARSTMHERLRVLARMGVVACDGYAEGGRGVRRGGYVLTREGVRVARALTGKDWLTAARVAWSRMTDGERARFRAEVGA